MPFIGGDPSFQPMSAPWNSDPANFLSSESSAFATPGAATWPPSAASSLVASLMDSSAAAPITEINLVSSPPTSHAASPSRTRSSPLRPSNAANILESPSVTRELAKGAATTHPAVATVAHMDESVANSDPEVGPQTPHKHRSPSPARQAGSVELTDQHLPVDGSSVYVQIPISSPSSTTLPQESSSSSKKKIKKQGESSRRHPSSAGSDSVHASPSTVAADAAYAAALAAQEENLARRRPTRSARKEVSYSPVCDLEGKPLLGKKDVTVPGSSSKSKAAAKDTTGKKGKSKRRSRAFSDDEDDEDDGGRPASKPKEVIDVDAVDADVTNDDVGFTARRDRKKPRVGSEGEGEKQTKVSKRNPRERIADDDDDEEALSEADCKENNDGDGILTPPAPTSPRRSSRKSVPSPKKQAADHKATKNGKGKQQKTFELSQQDEAEEEEDEQPRPSTGRKAGKRNKSPSPVPESSESEEEAEAEVEPEKPSPAIGTPKSVLPDSRPASSSSACSTNTNPALAASVAIKRINTSSPTPQSASASSPNARSFFGKPLTTLLNSGAVRRPGLTRKTKIPSLLNHRGAPKPPAPQLAASKRRMQDDDYEYDPDYEALIAKNKPADGSDEESDAERVGVDVEDGQGGGEVMEEYD